MSLKPGLELSVDLSMFYVVYQAKRPAYTESLKYSLCFLTFTGKYITLNLLL